MMRTEAAGVGRAGPRAVTRAWWPLAGVAILVFAAATITRSDADLWGHVRFGLDTLETHRLTAIDPYSFTQDRPWINHEWLSEVQMAIAYAVAGPPGLALLKAMLAFGTFALIWTSLRGASHAARIVVVVLVFFGTIHMTSTLRPQLWTFLCLGILCRALVDPRSRIRRWLPLVFALWVNVHGGWIVGLGILGVWTLVEAVQQPEMLRRSIPIVAGCGIATLCNPYGWKLWIFMAQTVRMGRSIQEWQPLWGTPALNWLPWFAAAAATLWMSVSRSVSRYSAGAVLMMLAYASIRVMRIESLFVESAAILLAPLVIARWPVKTIQLPAQPSRYEPLAALVMFIVPVIGAGWIASWSLACLPIRGAWAPDAGPVRLLSGGGAGRLVTYFDWGEYAIWHLSPRLRVSMDGRRETIYSDQRIAEHDAIVDGTQTGFDTLAQWKPEYVWLPAASAATKRWLSAHGYRIELETSRSFVAVRGDLARLPAPSPSPGPRAACFPG